MGDGTSAAPSLSFAEAHFGLKVNPFLYVDLGQGRGIQPSQPLAATAERLPRPYTGTLGFGVISAGFLKSILNQDFESELTPGPSLSRKRGVAPQATG